MKKILTALTISCALLPFATKASHCDGSTLNLVNLTNQPITVKSIVNSAFFTQNGRIENIYRGQTIQPGGQITGIAFSEFDSWAQSNGHVKLDVNGSILDIKYHFYTHGPFGYFDCHSKGKVKADTNFANSWSVQETSGVPADMTVYIGNANQGS